MPKSIDAKNSQEEEAMLNKRGIGAVKRGFGGSS
jgi:hypothetical protein